MIELLVKDVLIVTLTVAEETDTLATLSQYTVKKVSGLKKKRKYAIQDF